MLKTQYQQEHDTGGHMSWFNNDDAFKSTTNNIRRFWMKNGTDREVTFIDPAFIDFNGKQVPTPLVYQEYNLNMNGHWRNFFTRSTDESQDFLAELGHRASRVAALTVIDHSEWTDRKGNVHKDEITLYVLKRSSTVWKQLTRFIQSQGSLQGQKFRLSRMGDKSPGAGSLIEHIGKSDVYDPQVHKPLDYFALLAPKTREELMDLTNPDKDDFAQQQTQQPQQTSWGGQPQQAQQHSWGGQPQQAQQPQQPAWGNTQQPQQQPQQSVWGQQQPQQPPKQYGKIPF